MMRIPSRILIVSLAGAWTCLSWAASPPSAAGHWEGAITIPSGEIILVADLDGGPDTAWKGEADVPQQGIRNLAVVDLAVAGAEVSFTLPGIPGTPTFKGQLSEDGTSISGSLLQSGQTMPFHLERKGAAQFGVVPDDGVKLVDRGRPGEGVTGEWHGLLEAGPHKLRLIVAISATATAGLEGTLESVDQGSAKFPLANVTYEPGERTLSFAVPTVSGSFTGKLGADGSEASGQWSQGGSSLPLTFKRAK